MAFERIKKILVSKNVLLLYPNYEKPFDLTTDASSHANGALLSQNGRPITIISRTLSKTEENYALNKRGLLDGVVIVEVTGIICTELIS